MIALVVGTVLALGALAYVLFPLFAADAGEPVAMSRNEPMAAGDSPVDVLREIEFDRETGKLSDADYAALKAEYTALALKEMRQRSVGAAFPVPQSMTIATGAATSEAQGSDEAEAIIQRIGARGAAPVCVECGPRPEPDALHCSSCGRFLEGACASCGAPSTESDARFCADCGAVLAA